MLKLTTLALALVLTMATGCAEHQQMVALTDKCNNGDQTACQQLAQDEAPAPYPPNSTVRVMPAGSGIGTGVPSGVNLGGIGGMGGMGGMGGIGGGVGGVR
jgi:hypothetical protein